jgi:hypothetical protein
MKSRIQEKKEIKKEVEDRKDSK